MRPVDLLEKVRARALIRDLVRATAITVSLLGLFFLIYGVLDYFLVFSRPFRYFLAPAAGIGALAGIVRASIRSAGKRDVLWAALKVEQQVGPLNNELVMMAETLDPTCSVAPYLRERLRASLASKLSSIDSHNVISLWPSRPVLAILGQIAAAYAFLFLLMPGTTSEAVKRLILISRDHSIIADESQKSLDGDRFEVAEIVEELKILLTPPEYTGREPSTQIDDGNIIALAGTRVDVAVKTKSPDSTAFISIGGSSDSEMAGNAEMREASFIIKGETSFKVTVRAGSDPDLMWEGLYSIKALRDNPPEVHINQPASDLLFSPENMPASIPVRVRAKDEFGIGSIKLKYIKATGEGDASRFESGEIKVQASSGADGVWRGAAKLNLDTIGLEPGGSVVLHVEATDNNSLTGPSTGYSESIVLQLAEPEKVRIEVDNMSPGEMLKYLTSQRMILIKTEKLHRQRNRMGKEELLARSNEIALEQRRFRESFNEFSEIEPEHDHEGQEEDAGEKSEPEKHNAALPEIPAAGGEPARSMIQAIRAMWRAETALKAVSTETAIEFEKEALSHLKNAQKGLRYVPQIAPRTTPIDLKRRYKGRLDEIRNRLERISPLSDDDASRQLGSILSALYDSARSLASIAGLPGDTSSRLRAAAQEIEEISDRILKVRGREITSLVNTAVKLRLVGRMVYDSGKEGKAADGQRIIKLMADVCGQVEYLMKGQNPVGTIPAPSNLSPSAATKGATYLKLLAKPR